jgi:hypothetical protein
MCGVSICVCVCVCVCARGRACVCGVPRCTTGSLLFGGFGRVHTTQRGTQLIHSLTVRLTTREATDTHEVSLARN